MPNSWTSGTLIADARKARGWSQREVAEKVGVTSMAVSKWELERQNPSIQYRLALAELFDLDPEMLGVLGVHRPDTVPPKWAVEYMQELRAQIDELQRRVELCCEEHHGPGSSCETCDDPGHSPKLESA